MALDRRINWRGLRGAVALGIAVMAGGWDAGTAAQAQYQMAPWCAYLGSWGGSYDCSYYTFQQCMATASGIGNICLRNPRYVGDPRWGMPIWTTPLSAMAETRLEPADREALLRQLRDALH